MNNDFNKKINLVSSQNPNFDKNNCILEDDTKIETKNSNLIVEKDNSIINENIDVKDEKEIVLKKKKKKERKKLFKNLISEIMTQNKKDEQTEKKEHLEKIKSSLGGGNFQKVDKI